MGVNNLEAAHSSGQRLPFVAATGSKPAAARTDRSSSGAAPTHPSPPIVEAAPLVSPAHWPRRRRAVKRTLDIVISAVGLLVVAPFLPFIAVAIVIESPGPVFFRQRRLGRNGREFNILKLRTMRTAAEDRLKNDDELRRRFEDNGFKLPAGEDPRVTRVGRFLRRTSLDELPQLINVLRGDMSVVGPRPPLVEQIDALYGDLVVFYFSVRPGLTGPWQVQGRSDLSAEERCRLDVDYAGRATIRTDLELLLRTVPAVVSKRGAH